MYSSARMLIVKKKRRVSIPKTLNIFHVWNIIGSTIAEEIDASEYVPIPHCFDSSAYKIGNIFVPINTKVKCFRPISTLKVLGPIRDFVVKAETNSKWHKKNFPKVQMPGEHVNFRIIIERGKNRIAFTGYDYYFLNKTHDMLTPGNVVINRAAHEDLVNTKWIGLITSVAVAKIFEINIVKNLAERTLHLGDEASTFLFKYEICQIDENGAVIKSDENKLYCKWMLIGDIKSDDLPLTKFQSVIVET